MKNPTITVVIPAYNEEKDIAACLRGLLNQDTQISYEVVLVDNNSTDKTVEIARSYKVKIVREKQKGRGFARQKGFNQSQALYILSTDADTIVPPNWIEQMYNSLRFDELSCVTGIADFATLPIIQRKFIYWGEIFLMLTNRFRYGYGIVCGNNFGISKKLFDLVGGFNTQINGFEDVDLSSRVEKYAKIQLRPDIVVVSSARRFRNGLLAGFLDYYHADRAYKQGKKPMLSDIR